MLRALTVLCMGCMAIAAIVIATGPLRHFGELSNGTFLYYTVSLAVGVALLLYGFAAYRFRSKPGTVAAGGLAAGLALGINQFVGLHFGTILCFTPT